MADGVAVQEFNRSSLLHSNHMRNEGHFPLVDHDVLLRRIELFVRNRVDVDGNVLRRFDALHSDLAFDFVGLANAGQCQGKTCCDCCFCCDFG